MRRSVRTSLFLTFALLFLIIAPAIIAYSQGYRIDWTNKTLVQTGALSLEPRPAPVELFLDGALRKRSNFVFQNIFVGNLIPKVYNLQVRKEGYHSWQKNFSVAPKLVTEAKNILLFPVSPQIREIANDVRSFSFSPTRQSVATIRDSRDQQIEIIPLADGGSTSTLRVSEDFFGFQISQMSWSKDSTKLLIRLTPSGAGQAERWLLVAMQTGQPEITDLSELGAGQVAQPRWSLNNSSEILFTVRNTRIPKAPSRLFVYNVATEKLSEPLAYDVLFYKEQGGKVLYISSSLFTLASLDRVTGEIRQLSYHPIPDIERDPRARFLDLAQVAIQANGAVYVFDSEIEQLQQIADGVLEALPSADGKKLLVRKEHALHVYWLADIHVQPFHDAGEREEIWRAPLPVHDAVWVGENNAHVVFSDEKRIRVVELDGRDKRNVHTLTDMPSSEVVYEQKSGTLYFLSDNTLYSLLLK